MKFYNVWFVFGDESSLYGSYQFFHNAYLATKKARGVATRITVEHVVECW